MDLRSHFALLRPRQWIKNLLVFAALIFTARFDSWLDFSFVLSAFYGMCLVSSAVYVVNDLRDVERDRKHPVKKNRPIARGAVQPAHASVLAFVCLLLGLALVGRLGPGPLSIVGVYLGVQLLYFAGLKSVAVADVFCIATGFVLRATLGAAAINVVISGWLLLCTGALALMVGFGKRRAEFLALGAQRIATREALGQYSERALDFLVATTATGASLCYGVYALESPTAQAHPSLLLTAPFVFYGVCRYLLLVFRGDDAGEPETLFWKDPHLVFSVAGFVVTAVLAMTGLKIPILEGPR